MSQQFARGTADLLITEDHFVDAVVIPLVMRGHLIDPAGHAGVDVPRKDGHRPAIVTRPLFRIPGRGVARSLIYQVQLGIVGVPAPRRSAADLPLFSLPEAKAGVLADRLT